MNYYPGDTIKYKSVNISSDDEPYTEKIGIIEDIVMVKDENCYWVKGERWLIEEKQVLGLVG